MNLDDLVYQLIVFKVPYAEAERLAPLLSPLINDQHGYAIAVAQCDRWLNEQLRLADGGKRHAGR